MAIKFFSQAAPQWAYRVLGRSKTFRQAGCAITSCAMVLSNYFETNPMELDKYLDKNGGYVGDSVVWDKVLDFAKTKSDLFANATIKHYYGKEVMDAASKHCSVDYPVMMAVKTKRNTTHFVVLIDHNKGIIYDPAFLKGQNKSYMDLDYTPSRIIRIEGIA